MSRSAFSNGIRGRCPRCGEGLLFEGFLKIAPQCEFCQLDFSREDAGDGPAVFIMFIVGAILVPMALVLEIVAAPPIWLHMLLWMPLSLVLCLILLRPFKGGMFALQYHHDAREARLDEDDPDS